MPFARVQRSRRSSAGGLSCRRRRQGGFVGVDEKAYPVDFAVFARYHPALRAISGAFRSRSR